MSGCTTASDHHYLFPPGLEDAIDIEVEEARALGMRMTVTRGSMNLSQKDGGLPPDSVVQDEDDDPRRQRAGARRATTTAGRGAMLQVALAPCAPFTVTKRLMIESAGAGRALRLPAPHPSRRDRATRTHICLEHFGCRPLDYLEEMRLAQRPRLARARHPFQRRGDAPRSAGHGVGVCHCPTSNMVLASGHCRTRELEAAGCAGRPRRRRLGLQRQLQPDGERAPRADDQPAHL